MADKVAPWLRDNLNRECSHLWDRLTSPYGCPYCAIIERNNEWIRAEQTEALVQQARQCGILVQGEPGHEDLCNARAEQAEAQVSTLQAEVERLRQEAVTRHLVSLSGLAIVADGDVKPRHVHLHPDTVAEWNAMASTAERTDRAAEARGLEAAADIVQRLCNERMSTAGEYFRLVLEAMRSAEDEIRAAAAKLKEGK